MPGDDGLAVAQDVADVMAPTGIELTLSGNPVVFSSVIDILSLFLLLIPPAVFILLVAVFYATIGDRRLSVMAMVPSTASVIIHKGLVNRSARTALARGAERACVVMGRLRSKSRSYVSGGRSCVKGYGPASTR